MAEVNFELNSIASGRNSGLYGFIRHVTCHQVGSCVRLHHIGVDEVQIVIR